MAPQLLIGLFSSTNFNLSNAYLLRWFTTSEEITIEAHLGSDFLLDNFNLELTFLSVSISMMFIVIVIFFFLISQANLPVYRSTPVSLSHHQLLRQLLPGSYKFSIRAKPNGPLLSSELFSSCSQFSFDCKVHFEIEMMNYLFCRWLSPPRG